MDGEHYPGFCDFARQFERSRRGLKKLWRFTRNRIRHELMPLIERTVQGDPRLALLRLGVIAREAMNELQPVIDQAVESAVISRRAQTIELSSAKHLQVSGSRWGGLPVK